MTGVNKKMEYMIDSELLHFTLLLLTVTEHFKIYLQKKVHSENISSMNTPTTSNIAQWHNYK